MIEYKGYVASVEFDDDANILHGEIVNTRAVITFQATTVDELRREMEASVEDYLEWCEQRGKEPEKPFSGDLRISTTPEFRRAIVSAAAREHQSLEAWIHQVLERAAWSAIRAAS